MVGLQLYSVRDVIENDLVGTLRSIKDFGYDGVELCGFYGKTPAELKSILDEVGLIPLSAHVPFCDLRSNPQKVIGDYKAVGCKNITIPWLDVCDRANSGNFAKTIEDFVTIGRTAKDMGVTLSYHNHDFDLERIGGVYALDYLYDHVDSSLLKAEIDVCWISNAGENPVDYIQKYAGRLPLLHLKDFSGKWLADGFSFRPVGYGVQDIYTICKTATELCGTQWLVVEQDQPAMDRTSIECVKLSRDYLKSLGY